MDELLACRVCLATDVKLHSLFHDGIKKAYESFTGLQVNYTDRFPRHLCSYCIALLRKCVAFKEHCLRGHELLECALMESPVLTTEYISTIDRDAHEVSLPYGIRHMPTSPMDEESHSGSIHATNEFVPFVPKEKRIKLEEEDNIIQPQKEELQMLTVIKKDNEGTTSDTEEYKDIEYLDSENEADGKEYDKEAIENDAEIVQNDAVILNDDAVILDNDSVILDNDEVILENKVSQEAVVIQKVDVINNDVQVLNNNVVEIYEYDEEIFNNGTEIYENAEEGFENDEEGLENYVEVIEKKPDVSSDQSIEHTFTLLHLSKEEQLQEIQDRKLSDNYLNAYVKCEICFKGFTTYATYKNHMKRHDPSWGSEECEICHIRWNNREGLRYHAASSHGQRFSCKLCKYTCKTKFTAQRHHEWHSGRKYQCEQCGVKFMTSTTYLSHVRLQHPTSQCCSHCGQQFISDKGLTLHLSTAHAPVEIQTNPLAFSLACPMCNKRFHNEEAREKHISYAEDGICDTKLKVCRYCGDYLLNKEKLRAHQLAFHADVKCEECGKTFATESMCAAHYQRLHIDEKPYPTRHFKHPPLVCEVCGKNVASRPQLADHLRIHTGERPYLCPICQKDFRLLYSLKIHIRTHTGERPFPCQLCSKAFISLAALYRHERVHTAIKPYKCTHCGNCFTQSNALKLHVLTVHMKMPDPYKRGPKRRKLKTETE